VSAATLAEFHHSQGEQTEGEEILARSPCAIHYPTAGSNIYHDVPFGFVRAGAREQIFATSWLYCGGLLYVNHGAVKHFVNDGVIANTLAWGSRRFSNRIHWVLARQSSPFDGSRGASPNCG